MKTERQKSPVASDEDVEDKMRMNMNMKTVMTAVTMG